MQLSRRPAYHLGPWRIRLLATTVLAAAPLSSAFADTGSSPDVTVSESLSYLASNSSTILLNLGTSSVNGYVTNNTLSFGDGNSISFDGKAGVYHGGAPGVAAAPYTPAGVDTANYLAAEPSGNVTIKYSEQQKYFGIDWGSVDKYNALTFYNGDKLVDTVTGSQIAANANGNQTSQGSYLVNINFNGNTSYDRVVASSSTPAFEFDTVAFSTEVVSLEPGKGTDKPTIVYASDPKNPDVLGVPAPMPEIGSTPLGATVLAGAFGFAGWRRRKG